MLTLELKIPPVALVFIIAASMWLVASYWPEFAFELPFRNLLSTLSFALGFGISLAGLVSLRRARTTVHPLKPESATSLVCSGIYKFSRNPMYLGFFLFLLALGIFLANAVGILLVPLFVLYMNRFQIEPEERALRNRFGQDFVQYSSQVRRWF